MAGGLFQEPEGATPIEADDARGLIPTWIATRDELNAAEQENIAKALAWASSSSRMSSLSALLKEDAMLELHKRMFGEVWRWAGTYRRHDTNIGACWPYVPTRVRELLADVAAQTADVGRLPWPADELAVRFHHRLVAIHPFPNGNGRHARLAADLLAAALGEPPFSWGSGSEGLNAPGQARHDYLSALRKADSSFEYGPLLDFARS